MGWLEEWVRRNDSSSAHAVAQRLRRHDKIRLVAVPAEASCSTRAGRVRLLADEPAASGRADMQARKERRSGLSVSARTMSV